MKFQLCLLAALGAASVASGQKLVIKGSDTLGAKLVPTLAEAYKAKNPGVSFEIAAEGSTTGIAAIIDGTVLVVRGRRVRVLTIGLDEDNSVTLNCGSAGVKF